MALQLCTGITGLRPDVLPVGAMAQATLLLTSSILCHCRPTWKKGVSSILNAQGQLGSVSAKTCTANLQLGTRGMSYSTCIKLSTENGPL